MLNYMIISCFLLSSLLCTITGQAITCEQSKGFAQVTSSNVEYNHTPCNKHDKCALDEFCGVIDVNNIDVSNAFCTKKYPNGVACKSHYSCLSNYCDKNGYCAGRYYNLHSNGSCKSDEDCRIDQYCDICNWSLKGTIKELVRHKSPYCPEIHFSKVGKCHHRKWLNSLCWLHNSCFSNHCSKFHCKQASKITHEQFFTFNEFFHIKM